MLFPPLDAAYTSSPQRAFPEHLTPTNQLWLPGLFQHMYLTRVFGLLDIFRSSGLFTVMLQKEVD